MVLIFSIFCAISGFCLLGLETVWMRAAALNMGNTAESATLILGCYFLFAGLGAYMGSPGACSVRRALRIFALCELGMALSATIGWLAAGYICTHTVLATIGDSGQRVLYTVLLIGAPSFFSGIGFPCLAQAFIRTSGTRVSSGGWFYGLGLAGSALGALAGGIVLPLHLGYRMALATLLAIQSANGLLSLWAARQADVETPDILPVAQTTDRFAVWPFVFSGILTIGMEVLCFNYIRALTMDSIYVSTAVLFAFVINLGLGSFLARALYTRCRDTEKSKRLALLACAVALVIFPFAFNTVLKLVVWNRLNANFLLLCGAVTLLLMPVAALSGMLYPLFWDTGAASGKSESRFFARVLLWNKLSCAIGALMVPYVLIPAVGMEKVFVLMGLACAVAGQTAFSKGWPVRRHITFGAAALVLISLAWMSVKPPLILESDDHLIGLRQGPAGMIAVLESSQSRRIVVNNHQTMNGTGRALLTQKQEAWIPLTMAPRIGTVIYIGVASGIPGAAALDFPLGSLTAVEVLPDVAYSAKKHFAPWNERLFTDARARLEVADGRRYLQMLNQPADLVVCDLFFPSAEGSSFMYSKDFFALVKSRLSPDGQFWLWLPAYQLGPETAGMIIRSFLDAFPNVCAVRGNLYAPLPIIGLVGSSKPIIFSDSAIRARLNAASADVRESLFLRSPENLRLIFISDVRAAADKFSMFPATSDDWPGIAFTGPHVGNGPGERLLGIPLLEWMNTQLTAGGERFPSIVTDDFPAQTLVRAARAGNHLYASAVMAEPIPATPEKLAERLKRSVYHQDQASRLYPEATGLMPGSADSSP